MRVFLIGYMGVGKTTIGKKLSTRLGLKFIDLDRVMSNGLSLSISQIIDTKGEIYFRDLERETLRKVSEMEDVLVATGGGTPCFFDNIKMINQNGVSVFLKLDEKSLVKRLLRNQDSRPLIKGKSPVELDQFVKSHLSSRLPFYTQSAITYNALNSNSESLDDLASQIMNYSK